MPFDITLPRPGKEKSLKDSIITLLVSEWPLSARKIYNHVKKEGKNMSYQAVYKALNELAEQKILVKNDLEYSLNKEWVNQIGDFIDKIKKVYSAGAPNLFGLTSFKQEGEMQTYIFDCLARAEDYRKQLQMDYFKSMKDKKQSEKVPYCGQSKHLKSPLVYSEKSLGMLNLIKDSGVKCYIIVAGDTPIDKWCADFYRLGSGMRVRTGIKCAEKCDTMIIGDIVTQLYIPQEIHEYRDKVYQSNDVDQINLSELYHRIYELKVPVKFIVFRNPEIAGELRKQIMENYRDNINIFNIDGTVLYESFTFDFLKDLAEKEIITKKDYNSINETRKNYGLGKMNHKEFIANALKQIALSVKGKEEAEIKQMAYEYVQSKLPFYPYVKELMSLLNNRGKMLALSGVPSEIVLAVKEILGFDDMIATELEAVNGRYTGNVKVNMNLRENKEKAFKDYLDTNRLSLKGSFAFGNSAEDAYLLEKVEYPVALNPEKDLISIAKKNKWKAISLKDDVLKEIKEMLKNAI